MDKLIAILAAIDKDSKVAVAVAQKAAPIIAAFGPLGAEFNSVVNVVAALEQKLP